MKKTFNEYLLITIGVIIAGIGFDMFLIPNRVAAGGVSGISTILYYLFGFPVGVSMLVINIPLFIAGGKFVGKKFLLKTLYATVLLSLFIDFVSLPNIADDLILAVVYGGVFVGVGVGLVIYAGATTGGTDLGARLLHKFIPKISIASFLFIIDLCVVAVAAVVFDAKMALYAIASIYIASKLIEMIVQGYKNGKAYLIITEKSEEIRNEIIHDLDRGVTIIDAVGGYSKAKKSILLCVIRRNTEAIKLKNIVKKHDERAFMMVSSVTEVLGEGFALPE